jgi:hypothetical protein
VLFFATLHNNDNFHEENHLSDEEIRAIEEKKKVYFPQLHEISWSRSDPSLW